MKAVPGCEYAKISLVDREREIPTIVVKRMPTREELEDFLRKFFGQSSKYGEPVIFNVETGQFERQSEYLPKQQS